MSNFCFSAVEVTQLQTFLFTSVALPFHWAMVPTVFCVIIFVSCTTVKPTGVLPVGSTFKHAWAAGLPHFFTTKLAQSTSQNPNIQIASMKLLQYERLSAAESQHSNRVHEAITIRTTLSCKTHKYHACSCSSEELWRSHSTAICRDWAAKHKRITHNGYTQIAAICSSKKRISTPKQKNTDFWRSLTNRISTPKWKNDDFEALLKGIFKGKSSMPKWKKVLPKHRSQRSCSHYNRIYES